MIQFKEKSRKTMAIVVYYDLKQLRASLQQCCLRVGSRTVTVAEPIIRFRRCKCEPANGLDLSNQEFAGETVADVGSRYAMHRTSLRQTVKKVMESHLRLTIAFTVQSMPRARSEKGVYNDNVAARKSSMAFNIPFCGGFLKEIQVFFFLEEEDDAIFECIWGNAAGKRANATSPTFIGRLPA